MNGDLLQIFREDSATRLKFFGELDESCAWSERVVSAASSYILDFGQLEGITSSGLLQLLNLIQKLLKLGEVRFVHCPPLLVELMAMNSEFLGGGAILESLYLPVICSDCDYDSLALFYLKSMSLEPQLPSCPKCSGSLELDYDPDLLTFLKKKGKNP